MYRQFGDTDGAHFVLFTNPEFAHQFIVETAGYLSGHVAIFDTQEKFIEQLRSTCFHRPLHVLVISPRVMFSSPPVELMGDVKLLALPCHSSEITPDDIHQYLQLMELTRPEEQEGWSNAFFEAAERSEYLRFADPRFDCQATLSHKSRDHEWFEQLGNVAWAGQQFVPAGEISVLPLAHGGYDVARRLDLNGELLLQGLPIVNNGEPSFSRQDQARIFACLAELMSKPVRATVKDGKITEVNSVTGDSKKAGRMLECLLDVDSRYRVVWEIGIGCNTQMTPLGGNRSPNESYGHLNGCVHFGLGLTPWTQYHIDILCPETLVLDDRGGVLAGGNKSRFLSRPSSAPALQLNHPVR